MKYSSLKILAVALVAVSFSGQALAKIIAIKGGTVHTMGKKGTIKNAVILMENGRIKAVGENMSIPSGAEVINGTGRIILPGFMHSSSRLGLSEISQTTDSNEHSAKDSPFSAAFDVRYGLKSNSTVIADNRRHGLTHALTQPSGIKEIFSGSSAIISLSSDSHMRYGKGPMIARLSGGGNRNVAWARIRLILDQVDIYDRNRSRIQKGEGPADFLLSNHNMDALIPVLRGKQKLVLALHSEDDIRQAIALKNAYKLDLILSGAGEAWKVADALAAANIPVIIDPQSNLPARFGLIGATYRNAAMLDKAGVLFAISPGGMANNHNAHMVSQAAGIAVAHGLNWQSAVRAITLNPARIFGIEKSFGSIEKGKMANIVIWDGDPLEVVSNPVHVLVQGKPYPLISRRTLLRDRYMDLRARPFAYH